MDLMLSNFIVDDPPKAEKKKSGTLDSGGGGAAAGKFSMVFNKTQPVKAIVARKRVVAPKAPEPKKAPEAPKAVKEKKVEKPDFKLSEEFKNVKKFKKSNLFEKMKRDIPKVELPEVVPFTERVFSETRLDSLDIHAHSRKNVADLLGFQRLTVVQDLAIPKVLAGRDVLIRAQTGSGKTLAYALPLVEKLHSAEVRVSRGDGILAVVIVPTRELALQTYELFLKLLKPFTWIVSGYLCGGEKRKAEKARLRAGLNILIGTPGRFCDHIKNTESMKLGGVKYLVLDEADRLLELGYEKDVKEIVESIKGVDGEKSLQTVLLSATLTRSVKELAGMTLQNPEYVDTSDVAIERRFDTVEDLEERITIPATVRQSFLVIPPKLRLVSLSGLIAYELNRNTNKALVFMATQDLVDYHYDIMVEVLTQKKPDSDAENSDSDGESSSSEPEPDSPASAILLPKVTFFKLHGKMTQIERSSVFKEFRAARTAVLLCTDVAARGIDVPSVDLVVQYHAPQILADYVHRVGRTARAGQSGKAVLFLDPAETDFVKHLGEKQISLAEERPEPLFGRIGVLMNPGGHGRNKNREQAAQELQQRFERLVAAEKELSSGAAKAFVSWVRYYSNFPKELRRMFAIRAVNMGHYAKCLGLRDPPKQFVRAHTGPKDDDGGEQEGGHRKQWDRKNGRGPQKGKNFSKGRPNSGPMANSRKRPATGGGQQHKDLASYAKTSRMINTSEFASGLTPSAKKKPRKH
ncbi:DEAD box ATP-dependent RNA helicase [Culex quinquefasciatus]|uniref:ATP-dependent RNA helicase n=1 Tax=Culex quinquefasciatus TaxID=7176 RepID=B0XE49_CULQU|nr:DEAD box ATP-dependent RNA helicase [Culex quinquefasciatus]|eukprot:XP_001867921.1 DEAD box ATP-dependent RNA helicase [Culex quinquefasciatus]